MLLHAMLLLGRRHRELGALGRAFRPALHDGFLAGVETHAFLAVGVRVAKEAALPAAEAMPRHRYRDRHIDAHHADLDAPPEFPGNVAIAGVTGDAVRERVAVDELHRCGEVRHAHEGQYWAEDLLPVDAHLRSHMVKERSSEPEALLVAGDSEGCTAQRMAPSVHHQRRATCHAVGNVAADALEGGLADDRTHLDIALHAVADAQAPCPLGE